MKTIDTILEDMQERVKNNEPVSPAEWVDGAIKLNALKGDLDNEMAIFEAVLNNLEAGYIKEGESASKAKILAKSDTDYVEYLKAKAKTARIIEFIRLAKQRARIEEY